MASVVAYDQKGNKLPTWTGTWEEAQKFYDELCECTPDNIVNYQKLELYGDNELGYGSCSHLTRRETDHYYKLCQDRLRNAQMPLYGMEDDVVAHLIGFTREAFYDLGNAFIAWHITERQGGCWVFE